MISYIGEHEVCVCVFRAHGDRDCVYSSHGERDCVLRVIGHCDCVFRVRVKGHSDNVLR